MLPGEKNSCQPHKISYKKIRHSSISLFFIKVEFQGERDAEPRKLWAEIGEGMSWLWVLGWLLYAFAINPWVLLVANLVGFVVVPVYMMVQFSYRLTLIPDRLQGRVNSVFRLIAFGSQPIGLALTGALLQVMGPIPTVIVLLIVTWAFTKSDIWLRLTPSATAVYPTADSPAGCTTGTLCISRLREMFTLEMDPRTPLLDPRSSTGQVGQQARSSAAASTLHVASKGAP